MTSLIRIDFALRWTVPVYVRDRMEVLVPVIDPPQRYGSCFPISSYTMGKNIGLRLPHVVLPSATGQRPLMPDCVSWMHT